MLAVVWTLVAGVQTGVAAASEAELREKQVEAASVNPDPGETGGNEYYINCLTRRNNGDLACGEVCFWRECVQCQNLCECNPCDACDDETVRRHGTPFEWLLEPSGVEAAAKLTGVGVLPGETPFAPEQGVDYGFPDLDLGCPDHSQCPDLDCDCGGGNCWAVCGDCTEWDWRFLGPEDSGRYPDGHVGGSGAGFNVYPVSPRSRSQGGQRSYWRRDSNDALFNMALNAHLLADYYVGVTSRCAGIYGDDLSKLRVTEEAKEFTGGGPEFNNSGPYFWLHGLPGRRFMGGLPPARDLAVAEVTPEPYAIRARRCETELRDALESLAGGNSNVGSARIGQTISGVTSGCGGGLWGPQMSNGKSTSAGEMNECPSVGTGYYVNANVGVGLKEKTLVVHWQAEGTPPDRGRVRYYVDWRTSVGGEEPDDFEIEIGPTPTPSPRDSGSWPKAPLDRGACWIYNADDGWRSIAAVKDFDPPSYSSYTNTDSDSVQNAHFLGFIDSRPAPYLVVERPTGTVGTTGFEGGVVPAWFNEALLELRLRADRNFVLFDCVPSSRRFVTWTVNADTPDALTAEVQVESCWAYYEGTSVVSNVQFLYSHSVFELVSSSLGTKRLPLRRFVSDPLMRSGASAARETGVGDRTDPRICQGSTPCLEPWVCPYYNNRGLLRSSFSLQNFPSSAGEGVGGVRTRGIEVCNHENGACSQYNTLLVYPDQMNSAGNDADRYHVGGSMQGNSVHYTVPQLQEDGVTVVYVPTSRPWVGYRPVMSGGYLLLEYTDSRGILPCIIRLCWGIAGRCAPTLKAAGMSATAWSWSLRTSTLRFIPSRLRAV